MSTLVESTRLEPLSDKVTVRVWRHNYFFRNIKFQVVLPGCSNTRILAIHSRSTDVFSVVITEPTKPFTPTMDHIVLMALTGDEIPEDYVAYLGIVEERPGVVWHGFYLGAEPR